MAVSWSRGPDPQRKPRGAGAGGVKALSIVGRVELDTSEARRNLLELEQILDRLAAKFQGLKAEMTQDLAEEIAARLKVDVSRPAPPGRS